MKHCSKKIILITLLALLTLTTTCLADGWWDGDDQGPTDSIKKTTNAEGQVTEASRINWQKGYIEVMAGATADPKQAVNKAHAYAIALKTARHLAYEKLAETVSGLHITSNSTYDHELHLDSRLKTELDAIIRNARVIKEDSNEFKDNSIWVEVTLGLYFYGDNGIVKPSVSWQEKAAENEKKKQAPAQNSSAALTKDKVTAVPSAVNKTPVTAPISAPSPATDDKTTHIARATSVTVDGASHPVPQIKPLQPEKPFTGLIVDASGLDSKPAMLPKIIAENGTVVYSGRLVDPQYVKQIGLIGYQNSLSKAMRLDRVGSNPLVIKARGTAGKYHADYILSDRDASFVATAAEKNNFLQQCRVAVVIGK